MGLFGLNEQEVVKIVQDEILKHENLKGECPKHVWEEQARGMVGDGENAKLAYILYVCKNCLETRKVQAK